MHGAPSLAARSEATLRAGLLLSAELVRLALEFQRAGIALVVFKGAPLARRLGISLAERRFGDNDLLVHRVDVPAAEALLRELGYRRRARPSLNALLANMRQLQMVRWLDGAPLVVDLHWSVFHAVHDEHEATVWRHTELLEFERTSLRVFDPPLTLIHLASHWEQHAFCEPRTLREVARAWNQWGKRFAPGELGRLARELGLHHAVDFALGTADELGWLEHAPELSGSLRAMRLRKLAPARVLAEARPEGDYRRILTRLLLADPWRASKWIARSTFPPLERMAALHDAPPSWRLLPLYLTRPLRPLARLAGWKPTPREENWT